MEQSGVWNRARGAEAFGFEGLSAVHWNDRRPVLIEAAMRRGEGRLSRDGALVADTGQHTGRSAKDKFIVRDESTENEVWWGENQPMTSDAFDLLLADFKAHARGKELFAQDLYGGADPGNRIKARVFTELAWHSLFIRNLLIRPDRAAVQGFEPELTIVDLPSFKADPKRYGVRSQTIIAVNFARGIVLIGGTSYAGEMKKSVFTTLNYFLPREGVMPMHCSANIGPAGDTALFFGLSGTGKTTLSADPSRTLIGDDEHGWGPNGVFNFEGGCYAKCINLSAEAEPDIYAATKRFGSVLENVVLDEVTRDPVFEDGSKTENTRAAYPLEFIANASETGRGGHPKNIVMLTADAFGVMPPIAKLTPAQAMYHFLSGYTAKVAGTERGVTEPEATFSTCFGAPFMPRHPTVYGQLLKKLIADHGVNCWLVSTGWTGGAYGVGRRMPIKATRALLATALSGKLDNVEFRVDPYFGFEVPNAAPGVEPHLLYPRKTWADKAAYDQAAAKLVKMFQDNFAQFEGHVDAEVTAAAPVVSLAAE